MDKIKTVAGHLKSSPSTNSRDAEVLIDYEQNVCTITLNRPKALNAINLEMVRTLRPEIDKWNQNPSLKAIIFKGSGDKSFCSGGDMIRVFKSRISSPPTDYYINFFREEFVVDYLVATMKPTQIVFWDGIVMGGGVGISIHAPIRIATENAVFAMPEARVGLVTDVGSGYFLSRIKKNIGYYLGLTAAHLKGQELVQVGVADFYVKRENLQKLEQDIIKNTKANTTVEDLREIVKKYEEPIDKRYPNEDLIEELFGKASLEEIYKAVEESEINKEFTQKVFGILNSMSPYTSRVIFEQLKRGKNLDLKENLKMDARIMLRMDPRDAGEGVKCALMERGNKPVWIHKSVSSVTQEEVEKAFEKLEDHQEILGCK